MSAAQLDQAFELVNTDQKGTLDSDQLVSFFTEVYTSLLLGEAPDVCIVIEKYDKSDGGSLGKAELIAYFKNKHRVTLWKDQVESVDLAN